MCFIACPSPTVVVVLPSPNGVGVMAVTTTYFAFGRSASSSIASRLILARLVPYGSNRCSPMPIIDAISGSGFKVPALAMSRSDGNDMDSPHVRVETGFMFAQVAVFHNTVSVRDVESIRARVGAPNRR